MDHVAVSRTGEDSHKNEGFLKSLWNNFTHHDQKSDAKDETGQDSEADDKKKNDAWETDKKP